MGDAGRDGSAPGAENTKDSEAAFIFTGKAEPD